MLTKSIFRLKTYTAVLIISMIVFAMSIPLAITLAKSFGETRAQEYAYLIRPHGELRTAFFTYTSGNPGGVFQALYYILKGENATLTLHSAINLLNYVSNQTILSNIEKQSSNPLLANTSSPLYYIDAGSIVLYKTKLLDLSGIPDNEKKYRLRDAIDSINNDLSNELLEKYTQITGKPIRMYGGGFAFENLIQIDENHTLVYAWYSKNIRIIVYSSQQDLWHLGFILNKSISSSSIITDNDSFILLRIFGAIDNNNRLSIGNTTFNIQVLEKNTANYDYEENPFFKGEPITLYMTQEYFREFIQQLINDQKAVYYSCLGQIVRYGLYLFNNHPALASNISEFINDRSLIIIDPSLLLLNGYSNYNLTETLASKKQYLIEKLIDMGADIYNATMIAEQALNEDMLNESLLQSINVVLLIEYDASFIYSSPHDKIIEAASQLYNSIANSVDNLTEYISNRLEEIGTDKPPFSYLVAANPEYVTTQVAYTAIEGPVPNQPPGESRESPMKNYYRLMSGVKFYGLEVNLNNDRLYQIMGLRSQTWDPIGAMSLASLIPIVLMIGYFTMGESLETILATSRKWLATSLARGAYLKGFISKLRIIILSLSIVLALLGIGLAGALSSILVKTQISAVSSAIMMYRSYLILVPTLLLVPIVVFISARSKLSRLESLTPLESQRPVESVVKHARSRRRTIGSLFILFIVAVSLVLGLTRPDVERIFDEMADRFGGAGVAILAMILFSGIMISPFSPLVVLYYSVRILSESDRLFDAVDRLIAKLMGRSPHGELSVKSSWRLKELLRGPTRTAIISLSVVFGTIMSRGGLLHFVYPWLEEHRSDPSLISGLFSASNVLLLVGVIGAITLVLIYPIVLSRTFDYIRGHVAIMRARGGDRKTVISYVYGSFLPSIVFLLISSLLGGLLFVVAMDSVLGIAFIDYWENENYTLPHLLPWSSIEYLLLIIVLVLFLFLLPVFLAYRVAAVRDLARYLREEVF